MPMRYASLLLIDDDTDDQEIFASALRKVSTEIALHICSNAAKALEQLVKKDLVPDLIFLDLNMPVMNGEQFLAEIKKTEGLADIPVIIFSTSSHSGTIKLTREMGAADFITKPDKFDELVLILQNQLL